MALVTGAECIATRLAARRDPDRPVLAWTTQPDATAAPVVLGTDRAPVTDVELARGLDRPLRVFPLFENALRAAGGESIDEHQAKVSELWARFSEVAAANPFAWSRRARTAEEIRTVGPDNRMVAFPYPKLMNANDRVDHGAAMVLCSAAAARAAGVPEDRWVFPVSGADAHDHWFLSHRARPAFLARPRPRRPAGAGAGRGGHRRRRPPRPVLVLPVRRGDRRRRAGPRRSTTPAGPSR